MKTKSQFKKKEELRQNFNLETGQQPWNGLSANLHYAVWLENKLLEYQDKINSLLDTMKIPADESHD
jgi:hypothetical protein